MLLLYMKFDVVQRKVVRKCVDFDRWSYYLKWSQDLRALSHDYTFLSSHPSNPLLLLCSDKASALFRISAKFGLPSGPFYIEHVLESNLEMRFTIVY